MNNKRSHRNVDFCGVTGSRVAVTTCGEVAEGISRKWVRKWDVGWSGRRGTDGEGEEKGKRWYNEKAIVLLRRCEKLAVLSESESVKIWKWEKKPSLGQFMRVLWAAASSCLFFSFHLPLLWVLIFTPYLVNASLVCGTYCVAEWTMLGCFWCFQSTQGRRHSLP